METLRSSFRITASMICVSLVAVACATSCDSKHEAPQGKSAEYCAIMSDSVGLYAGNPVTKMGFRIGTIDSLTPNNTSVEVRFTLDEGRSVPRDAKAITRSLSILADRSLELVGGDDGGPRLSPGQCIPRSQTATPLSISQVIGSSTNFVNGLNPNGSTNVQDALRGVDEAVKGNGAGLNKLLTTSSSLSDNPDQAIADIGSIMRNMEQLTDTLKQSRTPLKQIILDMPETTPQLSGALVGTAGITDILAPLPLLAADLETHLGDDITLALDTVGDALRHLSPHYKGIANMLNPVPRFINTLSYYTFKHDFDLISWSPPLFRIRTPDGLALCGAMNASMPGSCADVNGQPHAVDVALLQYVLLEAQRR